MSIALTGREPRRPAAEAGAKPRADAADGGGPAAPAVPLAWSLTHAGGPRVQRACTCGGTCERCRDDEEARGLAVQRMPLTGAPSAAGAVLVDEGAAAGAGQAAVSGWLDALEARLRAGCNAELAGVGRSTEGCPYLERWLAHYRGRPAAHVEGAARRYTGSGARTPAELADAVVARARVAAAEWARTGQVPELPGALGAAASLVSGLAAGLSLALHRKADDGGGAAPAADPAGVRARLGTGAGLDGGVRTRLERGFGTSFAGVRVHTDDRAARLSRELGARAFTVGRDVAFGAGEYRPGTLEGDALIAHELAHTVQQSGGGVGPAAGESRQLEAEADAAAAGALGLGDARPWLMRRGGLLLQRCKGDSKPGTAPAKTPASTPTVPRDERTAFGNYHIHADADAGPFAANDITQAQFERIKKAWDRVNDNSGGLVINGSAGDKATMIAMLAREMGRTQTFRDLIIEITEDSAHPVTIEAGRNNAWFMDAFDTNASDITDMEWLETDAPAAAPWAFTQGEDIVHWLAERRYAALNGGGITPAHSFAMQAGGWQERFRTERGQPGRMVSQTGTGSFTSLFQGVFTDSVGNQTIIRADGSGAAPVPYQTDYVAAGATTPALSRVNTMIVEVTAAPAAASGGTVPAQAAVEFAGATNSATTAPQALASGSAVTFTTPLGSIVPLGGPITVRLLKPAATPVGTGPGSGSGTGPTPAPTTLASTTWAHPFSGTTATVTAGGVTYTFSLRLERR